MRPTDVPSDTQEQSLRFLLLYALAWAGGAIAYVPFLTVLLPVKMTAIAAAEDVRWLAYATFAGAVAASLANIVFGWLSDLTANRRAWIAGGLLLSNVLLLSVSAVDEPLHLVGVVIAWQIALNMMLGPLMAWAGDCVPDHQKGFLGGLLSFAPAAGALLGACVTIPGVAAAPERLLVVAVAVTLCIAPVLALGDPHSFPYLTAPVRAQGKGKRAITFSFLVVGMWLVRLFMQVAVVALFVYLLFYFRSVQPDSGDDETALLFGLALSIAVPVSLIAGQWVDRRQCPFKPLIICAALATMGLAAMAVATTFASAMVGYMVFGVSSTVFLALHAGQTLWILPRPDRRGRDLGLFNLTNTLPSLIMPWLTLALVQDGNYSPLLWVLALLTGLAGLLLIAVMHFTRRRR